MSLPLFILAIGAIFVGYLGRDAIIGVGSEFFVHAIYVHMINGQAAQVDPPFAWNKTSGNRGESQKPVASMSTQSWNKQSPKH